MKVLGIDTSNYTTSIAVVDENGYNHKRQILNVEQGERGLRQSDALFLHTKNLPVLFDELDIDKIDAVAYSKRPRDVDGSYMPCFLAGECVARSIASTLSIPVFSFSHQAGHIEAAIRTCGHDLGEEFLAFHLSGGTTELLHCILDKELGYIINIVGKTLDISAGQLIDRIGVLMGLKFPCGGELEKLVNGTPRAKGISVSVKNGCCNMSGAENKIADMLRTTSKEEVAKYTLAFVAKNISKMVEYGRSFYPNLPILFAGGVMRNQYIREELNKEFDNVYFAKTELSSDNAVGTAYLGLRKLNEVEND
ncbi:MAG: hypothetical protein MJ236_02770 [Clostridia bacterium]|nr:hypothetical protein [Clostridia bacterium]